MFTIIILCILVIKLLILIRLFLYVNIHNNSIKKEYIMHFSIFFVLIFGLIILVYGLLNYYLGLQFLQFLTASFPLLNPKFYWILFWIIASSYLIGRFISKVSPKAISNLFTIIGSYWLAIMFYSLLLLAIVDLLTFLNKYLKIIPTNTTSLLIVGSILILTIVSILAIGVYNANVTKIKTYNITINKPANRLKSLKIAMVSDIHLGEIVSNKKLKEMVLSINSTSPDVVIFGGDVIDESVEPWMETEMAETLKGINSKYGSYGVLGNHEYFGGKTNEITKFLNKGNVNILRDQYIKIADSFYIIGREDKMDSRISDTRKEIDSILNGVDKLPFILVDHQPVEIDKAAKNNIDLMLSGHTHKGQLFPIRLITKRIFLNDYGYKKFDNLHSIVSSGYGTWGPPLRVGSNSEIVVVNVKFE